MIPPSCSCALPLPIAILAALGLLYWALTALFFVGLAYYRIMDWREDRRRKGLT